MARNYFITGLDIGTSSIKGLVAFKKAGSSELEVISQTEMPVFGMRKGAVIDSENVSKSVAKVVAELENSSNKKINSAYINIGGSHIFVTTSRGSVAVSRADKKISQEDIERVLQSAQAISLPPNKEILDIFLKEFIIDGEERVKNVLGMQGIRLEAEILAVCAFSLYLKNLTTAVLDSGLQILDITPSPIAAARAVLTPQQKELGVAVIDIGAGTTGLSVYEEGDLIHTAIFPLGSAHITNDIAIGLRVGTDTAEGIKKEFGFCAQKPVKKIERIELPDHNSLIFSNKQLAKIIESRIYEIFEQVNKELKKISRQRLLPAGVVLTGGGTKLPGIVEFAKRELKLPVQIGTLRNFVGIEDDQSLATVCGLILGGVDLEGGVKDDKNSLMGEGWVFTLKNGIGSRIKRFFRNFIP